MASLDKQKEAIDIKSKGKMNIPRFRSPNSNLIVGYGAICLRTTSSQIRCTAQEGLSVSLPADFLGGQE